jgi:WD40 repeat protein
VKFRALQYLPPLEGITNRQLHKAEAAAKAVGGLGVVAFSPDGRKVATEVMEKKIVLLDVRTGERLSVLEASNATVQGVATASEVPEEQRIQVMRSRWV